MSVCERAKDVVAVAIMVPYLAGALLLERAGLIEGRDATGGPRWKGLRT